MTHFVTNVTSLRSIPIELHNIKKVNEHKGLCITAVLLCTNEKLL